MPRKKNQSADASSSGRDSTEKVPKDNEVQLRWRENTLVELQNMFTGSIDPEVVQLVLSESSYNGGHLYVLLMFYYHVNLQSNFADERFVYV